MASLLTPHVKFTNVNFDCLVILALLLVGVCPVVIGNCANHLLSHLAQAHNSTHASTARLEYYPTLEFKT